MTVSPLRHQIIESDSVQIEIRFKVTILNVNGCTVILGSRALGRRIKFFFRMQSGGEHNY